jgi:diguanylate cyclase (GGDEF)-like protein
MILIADPDADFARALIGELAALKLGASWVPSHDAAIETLTEGSATALLVAWKPGDPLLQPLMVALERANPGSLAWLLVRGKPEHLRTLDLASLAALGPCDLLSSENGPELVARQLLCLERALQRLRPRLREGSSLLRAQHIARIGHWEFVQGSDDLYCSEEARRILGLQDEAQDLTLDDLLARIPIDQREGFHEWLDAVVHGRSNSPLEHSVHHAGGSFRPVRQEVEVVCEVEGQRTRVTGVVQDLNERRQAEDRVQFLSDYDSLTGLANRAQFLERAEKALTAADLSGAHPTVLCLDLNQFKAIAGLLPDHAGDALLVSIARRLREGLRAYDTVAHVEGSHAEASIARIRGDEFTLLLPDLKRPADSVGVGQRLLEALGDPFEIDGQEVYVTASIGVSSYPSDGRTGEELLKRAETAAHCSRQHGRNSILFYTPAMNAKAIERLALETGLRRALERGELTVHYQPRVEIASGALVGMEALVRWKHPELGLVSPAQFIPIAEESGLIVPIGEWILQTACQQCRQWQQQGLQPVRMSVNLSAVQFRQPELFDSVVQVLRSTGLDPQWLEMELTESILMQNPEQARVSLKRLKREGIHLSIDDFGTGYSSLAYLKRFPIDSLKIDQTFIRELTTNPDDAAIATSIILLGRSLKLRVVAEGVETPSQLAFLRVMQCDEVQGYLFSPPVPAEEARGFLDGSRVLYEAA